MSCSVNCHQIDWQLNGIDNGRHQGDSRVDKTIDERRARTQSHTHQKKKIDFLTVSTRRKEQEEVEEEEDR